MAAQSKAQLLDSIYTLLKKRYKLGPRPEKLGVLESVVYGICHEGTTREQANQALARFKDSFHDWNELRVSSIPEIRDALAGLPDPQARAERLRKFLRQIFSKTYDFTLDALAKKPQKDAVKALQIYEAAGSDYVVATVIQQGLGGHALPVDAPLKRALQRLGVAEPNVDDASLRGSLERAVPKNRGAEFVDLMEELSHDTCVEGEPDCPRCELKKLCPTGQARLAAAKKPGAKVAASPAAEPEPAAEKPGKGAKAVAAKPAPPEPPAKPARSKLAPPLPASEPAKASKTKGPRPK